MIERIARILELHGEAHEGTPFRGEIVIYARINAIAFVDVRARRREVILLRVDVGRRCVGQRPVGHQLGGNRVDPVGGNDVVRERIARETTRIGRIGSGRQRIINNDWRTIRIPQIREISLPPFRQRHGESTDIRRSLPIAFVIHEEKGLVLMIGPPTFPPN